MAWDPGCGRINQTRALRLCRQVMEKANVWNTQVQQLLAETKCELKVSVATVSQERLQALRLHVVCAC